MRRNFHLALLIATSLNSHLQASKMLKQVQHDSLFIRPEIRKFSMTKWMVVALGECFGVILNLFQDLTNYAQEFPLGADYCYWFVFTLPHQ